MAKEKKQRKDKYQTKVNLTGGESFDELVKIFSQNTDKKGKQKVRDIGP